MLNKVQIIGNLGNDPETKHTAGGVAVTKISVATSHRWKNNKSGEQQEETSWHRVVFFDKLAEIAGEYLRKGAKVYVEGRLKYGSYEKDGVTVYTTDIIGETMKMLDKREGEGERRREPSGSPRREQPAAKSNDFGNDFADDDIPF